MAAKAIMDHLPKATRPCVAVTTFFPEVASFHENERRKGVDALRFVLRLVEVLNTQHNCRIQSIEMVGGSVVSDIEWRLVPTPDTEARGVKADLFEAHRHNKHNAHERLYCSLEDLAREIPSGVTLALELEPGPLCAISKYGDLVELHELLSAKKCSFGGRIGFNCDIAHFMLAGITPEILLEEQAGPVDRIVGFHLSDIGNGHFHDLVPGLARASEVFLRWQKVIDAARASQINEGRAGLLMSLELERALGMTAVRQGVEKMRELFLTS